MASHAIRLHRVVRAPPEHRLCASRKHRGCNRPRDRSRRVLMIWRSTEVPFHVKVPSKSIARFTTTGGRGGSGSFDASGLSFVN
jgi:hypothetical protein